MVLGTRCTVLGAGWAVHLRAPFYRVPCTVYRAPFHPFLDYFLQHLLLFPLQLQNLVQYPLLPFNNIIDNANEPLDKKEQDTGKTVNFFQEKRPAQVYGRDMGRSMAETWAGLRGRLGQVSGIDLGGLGHRLGRYKA